MNLFTTAITSADHNPDGTLVVFVHGLFGQGKNFTGIAKALIARHRGLSCLLIDLPNHGRSDWTDSLDQGEWADQVAATITATIGRPVLLVGHSLGGKVAMQLALRHPELVTQVVVVDISPVPSSQVRSQFDGLVTAMTSLDLTALDSRAQADQQLATGIPDPVVRAFLMQNLRHDRHAPPGQQWRWQLNLDLLAAGLDQVGDWAADGLSPYPGPVTWIAGALSSYISPDHEPAMRALFPQARKVTVKQAGHWVHSEQPEIFTGILSQLLTD